ncbi:MAG: hypothetical protein ACRC1W_03765, partial [Shewanella sp.]
CAMKNPQQKLPWWVVLGALVLVVGGPIVVVSLLSPAPSPPPPPVVVRPPPPSTPALPLAPVAATDDRLALKAELNWLDQHREKIGDMLVDGSWDSTSAQWNMELEARRVAYRSQFGANNPEYRGQCLGGFTWIALTQRELSNLWFEYNAEMAGRPNTRRETSRNYYETFEKAQLRLGECG